jgi:hypothetical protein
VPSRNPQLRQKRSADGMAEWQLEQIVVSEDNGVSGFCDINNATF